MTVWFGLQLLGVLVLFGHAWWDFLRAPRLPRARPSANPGASPPALRTVRVIVPARNEAANIGPCVRALLQQRHAALQVIVVDDGSDDTTAAIVETIADGAANLTLMRCPPRPQGWVGKSWALHCAVASAPRDDAWLCFVDADVVLGPDALGRAMQHREETGAALVTLLPALVSLTFWEKVVQPLMGMLMFVAQPLREINRTGSTVAVANGQFLLLDRATYDAVGGHAAIRDEIVEDVALARALKARGLAVSMVPAADVMKTRMYDGLSALWEGWGKTIHPYLQREPGRIWLGVVLMVWLLAVPFAAWPVLNGPALILDLLCIAVILGNALVFRIATRQEYAHVLLFPLGFAVLLALFAARTVGVARKRSVRWKGRSYA